MNNKIKELEDRLRKGNADFLSPAFKPSNLSGDRRKETAEGGQHPYAAVVTCSDSRVPPEHIFSAGIGDLFVIRTAGNVIGDFELGSVEYAVDHLKTTLVIVLGHTRCGAVDAALSGHAHGKVGTIIEEISSNLPKDCDPRTAEILNVKHSVDRILESEIIRNLVERGEIVVEGAIYDVDTGFVDFLNA